MVVTLPPTSRASKHSFLTIFGSGRALPPADSRTRARPASAGASAYIRWNRVPVGRLLGRIPGLPADSRLEPAGRRTSNVRAVLVRTMPACRAAASSAAATGAGAGPSSRLPTDSRRWAIRPAVLSSAARGAAKPAVLPPFALAWPAALVAAVPIACSEGSPSR